MNLNPATQERITHVLSMVPNLAKLSAESRRGIEDAVLMALKEQDRDTRHACAEAVRTINRQYDHFQGGDHACQIVMRAEQACINAHLV